MEHCYFRPLPGISTQVSLLRHGKLGSLAMVQGQQAVDTTLLDLERPKHFGASIVDAHWQDPYRAIFMVFSLSTQHMA